MIGGAAKSAGRPQQQTLKPTRYPAPNGGIDDRVSLAEGSLKTCVYAYNLTPYEYGMRVRKGFREWQIGLDDGAAGGTGVHTIIPFDGIDTSGVLDRLFAVTNEGIWDVTVSGGEPVLALAFADTSTNAGFGVYCHFVDDAGVDVLFFADNLNGLFEYVASTDTWAQATGITGGVSIVDVKYIVIHKQRLWMVEENSTKAWYLPVNSRSGAATEFFFGAKFRHGGNLAGLFNWTVDGGDGVDDMLVAVSGSGDVLPYKGSDPSQPDWTLVGSYHIGNVPRGPFFATESGGELYLLSAYGLISMNQLLKGVDTDVIGSTSDGSGSVSAKITSLLRDQMEKTITQFGWQVRIVPSEGAIIISRPQDLDGFSIQYYYNVTTGGWALWRGVPMTTFDSWRGRVVFGTEDNRVCYMDVTADNIRLVNQFVVTDDAGDGTLEGDVNATDFTGQTPVTGKAADISATKLTRFTHKGLNFFWQGITPGTVGLGGTIVSVAGDYAAQGTALNGESIEFSILSSFLALESPALYKKVKLIRPDFSATSEPSYTVEPRYDYNILEAVEQAASPIGIPGSWDVGVWNQDKWGSSKPVNFSRLSGGWGNGRYVAIAMKGRTRSETRFIGWDVLYTVGGPMI